MERLWNDQVRTQVLLDHDVVSSAIKARSCFADNRDYVNLC